MAPIHHVFSDAPRRVPDPLVPIHVIDFFKLRFRFPIDVDPGVAVRHQLRVCLIVLGDLLDLCSRLFIQAGDFDVAFSGVESVLADLRVEPLDLRILFGQCNIAMVGLLPHALEFDVQSFHHFQPRDRSHAVGFSGRRRFLHHRFQHRDFSVALRDGRILDVQLVSDASRQFRTFVKHLGGGFRRFGQHPDIAARLGRRGQII